MLKTLIFDPKIFNYTILVLYFLNVCRWLAQGNWADAMYWTSAFGITATVTWGYSH